MLATGYSRLSLVNERDKKEYQLIQNFLAAGVTGVVLWITMSAIFIFAHPKVRAKAYNFFWKVHQLYVLLYFLCIIHGKFRSCDIAWPLF